MRARATGVGSVAGLALAAMVLTGCGSGNDSSGTAGDGGGSDGAGAPSSGSASVSTSSASPSTSGTPSGASSSPAENGASPPIARAVNYRVYQVIHQTSGGGALSTTAVPLTGVEAARAFAQQAGLSSGLAAQVEGAVDVADVPRGQTLYGAVVALGCDQPTQVAASRSSSGIVLTASETESSPPECLAPVTTVALVLVDLPTRVSGPVTPGA